MPTVLKLIALCAVVLPAAGAPLPSCDEDTEAHCLGEDADMSPQGIQSCLKELTDKSDRCVSYLLLMDSCKSDISNGGACHSAHMDGETMPCLIQRMKPSDLSEACAAALPKDEVKGLAKFWADGKRALNINEIADLNADDKDTYNRWQKRKKGKKTDKDKEREYAVKAAKRERVISLVTQAIKDAKPTSSADALEIATAEAKKAVDEDMTGTLKPFSKGELTGIAKVCDGQLPTPLIKTPFSVARTEPHMLRFVMCLAESDGCAQGRNVRHLWCAPAACGLNGTSRVTWASGGQRAVGEPFHGAPAALS